MINFIFNLELSFFLKTKTRKKEFVHVSTNNNNSSKKGKELVAEEN